VAPRSEDSKLITRVITFELVQPIYPRYINVIDRQTDGRLTIAIPRFALHALRGKNRSMYDDVMTKTSGLLLWTAL